MKKRNTGFAVVILVCLVSIVACKPASDRFTNNGDGTVTDQRTGLVWLKNANPCGMKTRGEAADYCNNLASGKAWLFDGSKAGDWRLPTKQELQGLGTDPPIAWDNNVPPSDWVVPAAPFFRVKQDLYWSGTDEMTNPESFAWAVGMIDGSTGGCHKGNPLYVWPVRAEK